MSSDAQVKEATRAYQNAKAEGNRQEEARWANFIGNIFKNRGEYVKALKWLRIDYDVSTRCLHEKQLLATCQSLGEVYLRLGSFKDALIYQKKHLELAKDSSDLVEQQRASTQLGRTYHEKFLKCEDDHNAVHSAKNYFKSAMKLAQILKESPPTSKSSFIKEYIDAHNNVGMLEMDLDNLEEAKKVLTKGLEICDEEEVGEDDAGRSRLHHNLGSVFMELRMWDEARMHIEKDIIICKRIGHCQGEAKGYINLGELHYRVQKYEEANLCYQKALDLAKSMEDEDALVEQINKNIEIVEEATKVMDELKKEEQKLKKLTRNVANARGTPHERKCLLQQYASLDRLIEKSSIILAWSKHCEFAKAKKKIATKLCDQEILGDSFLIVGESYQKLRNFKKAFKWFMKSWEKYMLIGNLEGQALAKINIGDVLDYDGDWDGALHAFEEGYSIAVKADLPSVQLSALENMHYSHMIRFDNNEEARRLRLEIDNLKQLEHRKIKSKNVAKDFCSETETEGDDRLSDNESSAACSPDSSKSSSSRSKSLCSVDEVKDDVPLISLVRSNKHSSKMKAIHSEKANASTKSSATSLQNLPKELHNQQTAVGRKRVRIVLSDDESEMHDEGMCLSGRSCRMATQDATSDEFKSLNNPASATYRFLGISAVESKHTTSSSNLNNIEESAFSYKSRSPKVATPSDKRLAVHLELQNADNSNDIFITFNIDNELINVQMGDKLSIGSMKIELACLYYLQLPAQKRSKGLLPIIHHMEYGGIAIESPEAFEMLKDHLGNMLVQVFVDGWVQKRLMKLYIDCCEELSESPNLKLLKKLYISEVEDEVVASECELQDISIAPLLKALHAHKTVAMLDVSHNLLGNGTMEKLQQLFKSGQKYGDLTLDLHCNRFGPTALFQICECPALFTRLVVLNISGNRLTDGCGSYLAAILENCKALYSLNIEHCFITSRTIQKIAGSLDSGSELAQLCIGYNNPISGNAIINLLAKLATLKSFAELNLNGLKLGAAVVDSLCLLARTSCLSQLRLACSGIGTDGALQLTESLFSGTQDSVKLDLSFCGLTSTYFHKLTANVNLISGILELNLGGNTGMEEGTNALVSLLMNPKCCLRVLVVNNCQLGLTGVFQILQALAENDSLEELNLADNTNLGKHHPVHVQNDPSTKESLDFLQPNLNVSESQKLSAPKEVQSDVPGPCVLNSDCNMLEVADSEDDHIREEAAASGYEDSCTSSCQRNSSPECKFMQRLATAIGMSKKLQFLDMSNNGFSEQFADAIYNAWSSRLRAGFAWRHIKDEIFHLSTEANKCCLVKPCCRKD
ncbi:hypothetical protein HS088_TW02G00825 [Tripterygium wilfordii]|uniref:Protein TONSOKU n=1 Tax=Tripterygium wilfordii TaxID=458696 RepID=A0A7J7DZS0_TRIWF|nr:protein TONSOKU [Tripterygium wilfordii]KAF5751807.1 hypothetical protein HS088_TW02G00825 [Tripterygium wilfordii]